MLATLMLSQGVPMLLAGDEFGRTQGGNNNAYCQDNEISWVDWSLADGNAELLTFTQRLIMLQRQHPVFRRRRFLRGMPVPEVGETLPDIAWFTLDGTDMADEHWDVDHARTVTMFLNGDAITEPGRRGQRIVDDSFLVMFNAHHEPLRFAAPDAGYGKEWVTEVDTARPAPGDEEVLVAAESTELPGRSIKVLRRRT
jgi:glycogen operon protein